MKIESLKPDFKFAITLTEQELKDLRDIMSCNITTPNALSPDGPVRKRLTTLMDEFRRNLELL